MEIKKKKIFTGFIVDFISIPVTSAFTSATSVIIIGTQIKSLLGLKIGSHDFFDTVYESFKHIANTKLGDGVLGLGCCLVLIALKVSSLINERKKYKLYK